MTTSADVPGTLNARIDANQPPAAPWEVGFGTLSPVEGGLRAGNTLCTIRNVFGLPGARTMRLSLRVTVPGGEGIGMNGSGYGFTVGGEANPGARLTLDRWALGVTGRLRVEKGREQSVLFTRANGRVRLEVNGAVAADCEDPRAVEMMTDVEVSLPPNALLHELVCSVEPARGAARTFQRRESYDLSMCIDFNDDLVRGAWTERTFREAMEIYRRHHIKRVYMIDHYGYHDAWWHPLASGARNAQIQENIERTYESVGDFLPALVRAGHAAGIEVFALVKPYEGGLCVLAPTESEIGRQHGKVPHIGGTLYWTSSFVAKNPHLRLERDMRQVPADIATRVVRTLRFTAEQGDEERLDPARIRLWISPDNGGYRPYTGPIERRVERNGNSTVIVLDGLRIAEPYWAVDVAERTHTFGNTLRRLVEARDEQGRALPCNYAYLTFPRGQQMEQAIFTFDYPVDTTGAMDDLFWLDGARPLAFARGLERYITGAPCEFYPKARQWWMDEIERCIDAGVDGIDFRILNHNRTFDWAPFIASPPLVAAYRERFGVDIRTEPFDWPALRRMRGECYTDFLRQARARLKQAGKKMHLHVSERMKDPRWHTEMDIHFDWQTWMREGLADEITLKMSPVRDKGPEVIAAAREAGLKLNFCPYINGCSASPFGRDKVRMIVQDALSTGMDGLVLYENVEIITAASDGAAVVNTPWIIEMMSAHARR